MMLRTSDNEFIEVEDVEVERQAKLFQNIGDTSGDFSYEFNINNSSENLAKLNIPSQVDGFQKTIYTIGNIDLCDDQGGVIYRGYIRITGINQNIEASFFSGNNNWFNIMSGNISDLDLSEYEVDIIQANIEASWSNTSGIIFPFINNGEAITKRSFTSWLSDDFVPFIYVKDIIKKCIVYSGLKLSGEILSDWRYNHLITTSNNMPDSEFKDRGVNVSRSTNQTITTSQTKITFPNFTGNHFPGLIWDTTNNRYVADAKLIITLTFSATTTGGSSNFAIFKNGANFAGLFRIVTSGKGSVNWDDYPRYIRTLLPGDYFEVFGVADSGSVTVSQANLIIEVQEIKSVLKNAVISIKKQLDFVTGIFKLFNTVIDYNPFTKTVTVDFFKNCIRKDEIDISEYIDPDTIGTDYTEIISDFGNTNNLKYADADNTLIEQYNKGRNFPYGSGQIESNNEFSEPIKDILDSEFVASAQDSVNPLGMPLAKIDFTELEYTSEFDATVTNTGGSALFTVSTSFLTQAYDLIEVTTSDSDDTLIGHWVVSGPSIGGGGATFQVENLKYKANSNVKIRKVSIKRSNITDQVLMLVVADMAQLEFMNVGTVIFFENDVLASDVAYAWFYKPSIENSIGGGINDYSKSLSFGDNDENNAYQKTMIEDYWADLGPILQDPVKVYVDAYLPKSVFDSITFKQPLRIKCDRFNSRFYPNRITGYKDSSQPCTLELIKLP